jgi:hypothetical protein
MLATFCKASNLISLIARGSRSNLGGFGILPRPLRWSATANRPTRPRAATCGPHRSSDHFRGQCSATSLLTLSYFAPLVPGTTDPCLALSPALGSICILLEIVVSADADSSTSIHHLSPASSERHLSVSMLRIRKQKRGRPIPVSFLQ